MEVLHGCPVTLNASTAGFYLLCGEGPLSIHQSRSLVEIDVERKSVAYIASLRRGERCATGYMGKAQRLKCEFAVDGGGSAGIKRLVE